MTIYSDSGDAVLHVDDIVETWVKDKLRADGWSIDLNDVDIQIHWPHNAFKHSTQIHDAFSAPRPSMQLMNTQSFKNNSDKVQQLTFNVQRSTQASAEVSILRGFQIPSRHRPLISSPGDSPFSDLLLKDTETSKWTEQQRWQVESPVHVNPRSISTARLLLSETDHSARFTITTQVQGKVTIVITQNGRQVRKLEGDLTSIFRDRTHGAPNGIYGDRPVRPEVQLGKDGNVFLLTEGQMNMRYGIHQEVTVSEEPWDGTETDSQDELLIGTGSDYSSASGPTAPRSTWQEMTEQERRAGHSPYNSPVPKLYPTLPSPEPDDSERDQRPEPEDSERNQRPEPEDSERDERPEPEDSERNQRPEPEDSERDQRPESDDSEQDSSSKPDASERDGKADDLQNVHDTWGQGHTNRAYAYNESPYANSWTLSNYEHRSQYHSDAYEDKNRICCSSCIIL